MLKHFDSIGHNNWVTDIRNTIYSNGFGYIRESQNNIMDDKHFLVIFKQRLKDQFIQLWRTSIENNRKLIFYKDFKNSFRKELYTTAIDIP